jgi:thioredoxin-like negative regulator of GroEL
VRWEKRFDEALKKARTSRKPLMVDFWAEWCGWCHKLDQTTYVDPVVTRLSADFVPVKVDTEGGRRSVEIAVKYGVSTLPTIAFLTPSGRQIAKIASFQGPAQFAKTMETVREASTRVMALEAALEKDPQDPEALFQLGIHMFEQEFYEESRDLLYRATEVDVKRPVAERKQARMLVGIIQKYDRKLEAAESVLREGLSLTGPTEYDPKIMYILARVYMDSRRPAEARPFLSKILTHYPDSSVSGKARDALKTLDEQARK